MRKCPFYRPFLNFRHHPSQPTRKIINVYWVSEPDSSDLQCSKSCTDDIWDAAAETVMVDEEVFRAKEPLPRCPACGALARPNILMFDDYSWLDHRTNTQRVLFNAWLKELATASAKLAVIELGAGGAIPTVRRTSERVAAEHDGTLVRINPREDEVPPGQIGLPFGAAEGMRRICETQNVPIKET